MYKITFKGRVLKQLNALERKRQLEYRLFFEKLAEMPFIDELGDGRYHAHVKYHWVAVWTVDKAEKKVTITYVGSRENAPY